MGQEIIKEAKKNTFTKSIMSVIMFLYFIGAVLGLCLVILSAWMSVKNSEALDTSMFIAYAAYIGTPTTTALVSYAWKSKAENVVKIAKSFESGESMQVMDTLSRMGGN